MNATTLKAALLLLLIPSLSGASDGLLGNWQCQGDGEKHSLVFQDDSTLVFDGAPSRYALLPGTILVQGEDGLSSYGYQLSGNGLAILLPGGSTLKCQQGHGVVPTAPSQGRPPARGKDNAVLKRDIAGTWWGYSGNTERKIGLCPDGSYVDFSESGYSGRFNDAGGAQTGAWGAASRGGNRGFWTIQGDYQAGVIQVQTTTGEQLRLGYRQVGEPGCLDINGNRLCRTSARCQ